MIKKNNVWKIINIVLLVIIFILIISKQEIIENNKSTKQHLIQHGIRVH